MSDNPTIKKLQTEANEAWFAWCLSESMDLIPATSAGAAAYKATMALQKALNNQNLYLCQYTDWSYEKGTVTLGELETTTNGWIMCNDERVHSLSVLSSDGSFGPPIMGEALRQLLIGVWS